MPYMKRQLHWISRTVMVQNNNVEEALKLLNSIMSREGMYSRWMKTRYYEKPCQVRQRVNYEKSRAIYNEDMNEKIRFIMRKNRKDPYPGC
ncbi:28S ribosomal protein S21, mitochondrial [Eurytemora carolleeae]|uniref:28S ribosomal protein S21, mitochondrial n=1 Tax=Eurytemora carolleeae TaxID=1294199 RepID=UPI000C77EF24|nr:28S ribosomal protein S21, mitochondrial [Eurytemora carolleeae]|eukprot:XP_023337670.1 28S ribosomal protein S21, mitochondrial-like [Eurytemora affinis]